MTSCKDAAMRAYQLLRHGSLDWFDTVSIETQSDCNNRCSYCPVSVKPYRPHKRLETYLVMRVLNELEDTDFVGSLMWGIYNEPMLDERTELFIATARERVPWARQTLFTNGHGLSLGSAQRLFRFGLRNLVVSQHGGYREDIDLWAIIKANPKRIQVNLISDASTLSTRAGYAAVSHPSAHVTRCPSRQLLVSSDGSLPICCNDWKGEHSFGNLHDGKTMRDIWFTPAWVQLRKAVRSGDFTRHKLCRKCTDLGGNVVSGEEWLKMGAKR